MSSPTRILISGASGQVGVDLLDVLSGRTPFGGDPSFQPDEDPVAPNEFAPLGLNHHELDVTDEDAVAKAMSAARPDVVIHLAAYTAVDRAEEDAARCYVVNEQGTSNMSAAAGSVGAHFIAISTDYVFDGTKGGAYVETDATNPLSIYGASKLGGEKACSSLDTIVRTSWVMGVRGKNVMHVIADRAMNGGEVRFVNDQMGTVTNSADLSRALVPFIRERPGGTWHVANSGATTWFDIAESIGSMLGRGSDFATAIATSELSPPPLATRPARSDLDTSKFASRWSSLPLWEDALARLVRDRHFKAAS